MIFNKIKTIIITQIQKRIEQNNAGYRNQRYLACDQRLFLRCGIARISFWKSSRLIWHLRPVPDRKSPFPKRRFAKERLGFVRGKMKKLGFRVKKWWMGRRWWFLERDVWVEALHFSGQWRSSGKRCVMRAFEAVPHANDSWYVKWLICPCYLFFSFF